LDKNINENIELLIKPVVVEQKILKNTDILQPLENSPGVSFVKSEIQIKLEKIREQKKFFNKKTKFHKIYLPKDKTRIFRLK
jgi:hypothetical protein